MTSSRWLPRAMTAMTALLLCAAPLLADGGTLRFSKQCDDLRVTLFTSPTSLQVGLADFSVLVQDAKSGAAVLDVPVVIRAYPMTSPSKGTGGEATAEAATNKLFRAIQLELTESGPWQVEITIQGRERASQIVTDIDVAPPTPAWIDLALWMGWPAGAILLFALHQMLAGKRNARQLMEM